MLINLKKIVDRLAILIYGKTKKEEEDLLKSFDGKVCREELRRITWFPRLF